MANVTFTTEKANLQKLETLMQNLDLGKLAVNAMTLNLAVAITQTWQSVVLGVTEVDETHSRVLIAPEIHANLLLLMDNVDMSRFRASSATAFARDLVAVEAAVKAASETDEALPAGTPNAVPTLTAVDDEDEKTSAA